MDNFNRKQRIRQQNREIKKLTQENEKLRIAAQSATARREDLDKTFGGWLNNVWGLVYPQDPTGWEYPAQVFRHIRESLQEHKTELQDLRDFNENLQKAVGVGNDTAKILRSYLEEKEQTITTLRASLGKVIERLEEINTKAQEILTRSYERQKGYTIGGTHYRYETGYLRDAIADLGLLAKSAIETEKPEFNFDCSGCGKGMFITEVKCSDCSTSKPDLSNLKVGIDPAKGQDETVYQCKGGILNGFTFSQEDIDSAGYIKNLLNKQLADIIYSAAMPKSLFPEMDKGFNTLAPGGIEIKTSPYMPEDMLGIFDGDRMSVSMGFNVSDLSRPPRPEKLKALDYAKMRERRIDAEVKKLIRPKKYNITINVKIKPSKAVEELAKKIESIRNKAELEIEGAVNKLLGKCSE